MTRRILSAWVLVLACSQTDDGHVPANAMTADGHAIGTHPTEDREAECSLQLTMTGIDAIAGGYTGDVSGDVYRTIRVGTNGLQFQAFVGGPGMILESAGMARLGLVGDQTGAAPFWQAIETLTGTGANLTYGGRFDCAPIGVEIGPGVADTTLTVQGTWTTTPIIPD